MSCRIVNKRKTRRTDAAYPTSTLMTTYSSPDQISSMGRTLGIAGKACVAWSKRLVSTSALLSISKVACAAMVQVSCLTFYRDRSLKNEAFMGFRPTSKTRMVVFHLLRLQERTDGVVFGYAGLALLPPKKLLNPSS